MTRRHRAAHHLWYGSIELAAKLGRRTAAWIARGRRQDLAGWRAALGCWLRFSLVLAALWLLWKIVRGFPNVLWLILPVWCWRAVRAAPPYEEREAAEEPDSGTPSAPDAEAVRTLLTELIGDRPGVHLSTVLDHLQKEGQGEGWEVADLRARLEALGVPVRRSVKVNKRVAYGVHRDGLAAPSLAAVTETAA